MTGRVFGGQLPASWGGTILCIALAGGADAWVKDRTLASVGGAFGSLVFLALWWTSWWLLPFTALVLWAIDRAYVVGQRIGSGKGE
jgi:hypothetical protein